MCVHLCVFCREVGVRVCFYLFIKYFASFTLHLPTMEHLATVFSFMISLSSGAMEEEWGGGGVCWGSHYTPLLIKSGLCLITWILLFDPWPLLPWAKKEKGIGFSRQRGLGSLTLAADCWEPPQLLPELNSASLWTLEKPTHVQTISLHGSLWMRATHRHLQAHTQSRQSQQSPIHRYTHAISEHSVFDLHIHIQVHC